jgi:hypothetical protein
MIDNIGTEVATVKDVDLDEFATVIRAEIQKCRKALSNALDAAMNAGDALRTVRPKVDAAGIPWQRWLKDNCFIGKSTALLYVQLAEHRSDIEAAIERGVELSLRAARRLISTPRKNSAPPTTSTEEEEESLVAHWERTSAEDRAGFLDVIGVDAILKNMSPNFGRELRERWPARAKQPDKKMKTITLHANPPPPRESRSQQ